MMDEAANQSIAMTATLFGLPEEMVRRIVEVGLPMMAKMAADDPRALAQLYAQSLAMMTQSLPAFYGKLGEGPPAQRQLQDDFTQLFGPKAPLLTRDVADRAGANEEQVGKALAGATPGMAFGLGKQNPQQSQTNFSANLARLIEQHSGQAPTRVGATQQEGQVLVWAAFDTLDGAASAREGLQASPLGAMLHAENVAVIEKDGDGKVSLSESADPGGTAGAKRGVGVGALLSAVIGPLGLIPAVAGGGAAGGLGARLRDTGFDDDALRKAAEQLAPNSSALACLVDPETANGMQQRLGTRAKQVRNIALTKKGVDLLQRIRS
jgi:uncharacterized membrane protein